MQFLNDLIAKLFGLKCPMCKGKLSNIRPSTRPIYDIWECTKCSDMFTGGDLKEAYVDGYVKTDPTGRKAVLQKLSPFHCESCGKNFKITERQTVQSSRIKCPRCGRFTLNDWYVSTRIGEVNDATETI